MNERKIIREFLDLAASKRHDDYHDHETHKSKDYSLDGLDHDHFGRDLDPNKDGHVTPEDLYSHFDLNGDGHVTTQDYVDHIQFHCAHPESLDHYKQARQQSIKTVPCTTSYDTCSQHLMSCPDDIEKYLQPLMDQTGSTCKESSTKALLDVLQSLINCGVFG